MSKIYLEYLVFVILTNLLPYLRSKFFKQFRVSFKINIIKCFLYTEKCITFTLCNGLPIRGRSTNPTAMKISIVPFLVLTLLISSCAKRNLTYFSDIEPNSDFSTPIKIVSEVKIKPYDRLKITVNSSSNESNLLFNRGRVTENVEAINTLDNRPESTDQNIYLVNQEGMIDFPILGQIKLGGLTLHEGVEELKFLLKSQVKEPSVNLMITNFKVTVIGEVNRPSSFIIGSERISIFEALGLAGDLTLYGKRENVLVMRDVNGVRNAYRVNLNTKDVFNSPYYYLEQNDIIYVETDSQKEQDAKNNSTLITVLSVASSVLVALIFNFQNLFN